jgi:hypothetical protein
MFNNQQRLSWQHPGLLREVLTARIFMRCQSGNASVVIFQFVFLQMPNRSIII